MKFENIRKFPGHCSISTEVIIKKNIRQTDKFTTWELKTFLERDRHKTEIFSTKKIKNRSIL